MRKAIKVLLLLMLIPVAIGIGLLIDYKLQPVPVIPPLPNPNGYDDLVKAGTMVSPNSVRVSLERTNEAQLRSLVSTNADALALARVGLSRECRMPLAPCFGPSTYHHFTATMSFLTAAFLAE